VSEDSLTPAPTAASAVRYRFLLIPPFRLPTKTAWGIQTVHLAPELPRLEQLMNAPMVLPYLEDIEWNLHPGEIASYGNWPVETREMCRTYSIVCTANAFSQMYLATMLGNKFTVIDIAGVHNIYYRDLIYSHQLQDRCASIRNIAMSLPRPSAEDGPKLREERDKALVCKQSLAVDNAIEQAELAVREDGAEVITLGCSAPSGSSHIPSRGWDTPVMEGYTASIELVNQGINASGMIYMTDKPEHLPKEITI
jgi:allantoin racemase